MSHHFTEQPFFGWFISPPYSFCFIGGIAVHLIFNNPRNGYAIVIFVLEMLFSIAKAFAQVDGFLQSVTVVDNGMARCCFFCSCALSKAILAIPN
jgi:hypothetical protein